MKSGPGALLVLLLTAACVTPGPVTAPEPRTPLQFLSPSGDAPELGLGARALFDGEPFTADPAAVLDEMARTSASGSSVDVLFEDVQFLFDALGRRTTRFRRVFRLLTPAGIDAWGTFSAGWTPWREAAPELHARVIGPDGVVTELDPATVGEAPAGGEGPGIFGDRRVARAPLPGLVPGAVVEQLAVVRETRPFFEGGSNGRYQLGDQAPVWLTRVTLEAPEALPLRWQVRGATVDERVELAEGLRRVTLEAAGLAPLPGLEALAPDEAIQWPYVEWSVGASWAELAAAYATLVDAQIAAGPADALAKEAVAGAKDRDERIRRIAEKIASLVRYTGLEFGEGAVVPRSPRETLVRAYGDCKDKATLMVSMLRAVGIDASVALLAAGPGPDVDPDLPGLARFDHAIVHVPGGDGLWIDPTHASAPPGVLPGSDQGRLALIASPKTRGLVRLPRLAPAASTAVKVVELHLAEHGAGRMDLEYTFTGTIAAAMRGRMAGNSEAEVRAWYTGHVKDRYSAESIDALNIGDHRRLTDPHRISIQASGVSRAFTDASEGAVALQVVSIFEWLPDLLTEALDDPGVAARTWELVLPEPFVSEVHYRVVLPPGWVPGPLPPDEAHTFGPATLTRTLRHEEGLVLASWRFDTGSGRFAPEAVAKLRAQMKRGLDAEPLMIKFDLLPAKARAEGRLAEAIEGYRELAALHPEEGLHHAQLARALLEAGFGAAAVAEAREAVRREPELAWAHETLGWALQHDALGRLRHPGFDHPGAVAAYREANRLDPESAVSHADLAILLEHDAQGRRYAPGADLDEAIRLYREIRDRLESERLDSNLLLALFRAGRLEEAASFAARLEGTPLVRSLEVAAVAASGGPEAGEARAFALEPQPKARAALLTGAAFQLLIVRQYAAGRALMDLVPVGEAEPGLAEGLALFARLGEAAPLEDAPTAPVRELVRLVIDHQADQRLPRLKGLLSSLLAGETDASISQAFLHESELGEAFGELPPDVVATLVLAALEFASDGDEGGWRVRARVAALGKAQEMTAYVVREAGGYRLLSAQDEMWPLGALALRELEAGREDAALRWLDWAREAVGTVASEDPLGTPVLAGLWGGKLPRDAASARLAAAALATLGGSRPEGLEALREASGAQAPPAASLALALGLNAADRPAEAAEISASLLERFPGSELAFRFHTGLLGGLSRFDEVRRVCASRLRERPEDPAALWVLANLATRTGALKTAEKHLNRLVELGRADGPALNQLAWIGLFTGAPVDRALGHARRAVAMMRREQASLHTLATLQAEAGRAREARETLLRLLAQRADGSPRSDDWYVIGRLAEHYGLEAEALDAYRRVEREAEPGPVDTWHLARRRLEALTKGR